MPRSGIGRWWWARSQEEIRDAACRDNETKRDLARLHPFVLANTSTSEGAIVEEFV